MSIYTVKPLDDFTIFTTAERKGVPFSAEWATTREDLARELTLIGAHDAVLELAVKPGHIRADGTLRADVPKGLPHPGVRLSFQTDDHGLMSFTCDTYESRYWGKLADWQANLRAIVLTLQALRAVDRYGATQGEQYAGFAALPPGKGAVAMGGMTRDEALSILRGRSGMPALHDTPDLLKKAHRVARSRTHPDLNDGDQTMWDQVAQAARVLGLDS